MAANGANRLRPWLLSAIFGKAFRRFAGQVGELQMMHWGDDLIETSMGLDILGVRQVDQGVEIELVNGITTISQRARYLSILTWALGEFQTRHAETGYDQRDLLTFLSRLEFLVLAATYFEDETDHRDTSGTLGSTRFAEALAEVRSGNSTRFPENSTGSILGTYLSPCRAAGLLVDGGADDSVPYKLTPRGREILQARRQLFDAFDATTLLLESDQLAVEDVKLSVPGFSLNRLRDATLEKRLLREALREPWGGVSSKAYGKFNATVEWISNLAEQSDDHATGFLSRNYNSAVEGANGPSIAFEWAEYEYRRRCHFALELVLSALTETLGEFAEATISDVVSRWTDRYEPAPLIRSFFNETLSDWHEPASRWFGGVPAGLFVDGDIPYRSITALSAENRLIAAVVILEVARRQTEQLRRSGQIPQREAGLGERVIDRIEIARDGSFADLVVELLNLVALAHLETTFRKMAAGQKCSLRFFLDGERLRSTGLTVQAGRSGDRLTNVMRFLCDLGEFKLNEGKFSVADGPV